MISVAGRDQASRGAEVTDAKDSTVAERGGEAAGEDQASRGGEIKD